MLDSIYPTLQSHESSAHIHPYAPYTLGALEQSPEFVDNYYLTPTPTLHQ